MQIINPGALRRLAHGAAAARFTSLLLIASTIASLVFAVLPVQTAYAATIIVDRTDDPAVTTAGTGAAACTAAAGDCSLRGAVIFANANAGTTINLPAGTYTLSIDGNSEGGNCGNAAIGDLDIAGNNTTIAGAGSAITIIQQTTAHDRVFCVDQFLAGNFNFNMSGVTIEGGKETWGIGGGGMIAGSQGDVTTLTDVVFSNNVANLTSTTGGSPIGGGLALSGGSLTCTDCKFTNNTSTGSGGGLYMSANYTGCSHPCAGTYTITNSTFSNNISTNGNGGGMIATQGNSYSVTGSTFSGNQAQGTTGTGGALFNESGAMTVSASNFLNNSATGASGRGGAIGSPDGGGANVSVNFSRFVGNTAISANGNAVYGGSGSAMNATDNWWGRNGPAANDATGAVSSSPFIVLKTTASPATVNYGVATTLTSSFLQNSSGGALTASQISVLLGLPVNWTNAAHGALSNEQPTIQSSGLSAGTATATFTAGSTSADCGAGSAEAKVDNVPNGDTTATAAVTVNCPDLQVSKTNNVSGITYLPNTWTWTLTASNAGPGFGTFSNGQTILTDNLPNSAVSYGTVTVTNGTGVTGTIVCSVNVTDDLSCTANGSVEIDSGASFTASFVATPTAVATYANPRSGGACAIDPNNNVPETNDANNSCSDSVVVTAPDLTVVKSDNVSGAIALGGNWTWKLHVANSSPVAPASFLSGQVILTDNLPTSNIAYGTPSAGNDTNITGITNVGCGITSNTLTCVTTGAVTIGASGSFDVTFTATPSAVGTYTNPVNSGTCAVDPNNVVAETNEANNNCNTDAVTVSAPDLTITKTNDSGGTAVTGQGWDWILTTANVDVAPANFPAGSVILRDDLDNSSGLTYGTPTVGNANNVTNSGAIQCAIDLNETLTCTANAVAVTIGASSGSFTVTIPVSGHAGSYTNPRNLGVCAVDPGNVVAESNESNNNCTPNTVTVNLASTTTTLSLPASADVGAPASFNVNVAAVAPGAGTPTGTVTVSDGGVTNTCIATLSGGSGSCSITFNSTGTYAMVAHYNGDGNFQASVSSSQNLTVHGVATTTTLATGNPTPSVVGQTVSFSYTVTPNSGTGTPGGTVTVSDTTDNISCTAQVSDGSCNITFPSVGSKTLKATYNGDSNFDASTSSPVSETVNQANTSTAVTLNPSQVTFPSTFTATAQVTVLSPGSGTPTGTVAFYLDGSTSPVAGCGTTSLDNTGKTICTISAGAGLHAVTATYSGDSNFNGSNNNTNPALEEVDQVPAIITNPTSETVNAGQTASFTATASGFPTPTVQWQVSTDGGGTFTNISGATSTTYSFTAAAGDNGNQFRAVFTNIVGNATASATTSAATLTVHYAPSVSTNPSDVNVLAGQTATFSAAASGNPTPTVQWQQSTDGGATFTNIAGATSITLSFTAQQSQNGNKYRAVFTNSVGSATTTAATLSVGTPPTVTLNPTDVPVNAGQTASFTAAATGNPTPTVQWQVSTDSGVSFTNLSGATNTTLSFTASASQNGYLYRAVFTNGAGTATTTAAKLTVRVLTSLLYNGGQIVVLGSSFVPAAQLTSSNAICSVNNQTITFSLDRNPLTGVSGSYSLGSTQTNSSGQATLAAVGTTGWQEGVYTVSANFSGSTNCLASSDTATLTAAGLGDSANGGGWYTLSGSGRINFGFTVSKVLNSCTSNCAYKGQVLLINNSKWRLKGNLTGYVKTTTGTGSASGAGALYWWNQSLNGGLGDWALAQSSVNFTISFFDGGTSKKVDTFGINIQYKPVSPQPSTLPNSTPQPLKGGTVVVK